MKLFIADETEAELDEYYCTIIGDNYKKMLNNDPSLLSEVLSYYYKSESRWLARFFFIMVFWFYQ